LSRSISAAGTLLSRFIRDPAEVEDVAQEAFIKAYRALPRSVATARFTRGCTGLESTRPESTSWPWVGRAPTSTEVEADEAEGFEEGEHLRDINTRRAWLLSKEIAETVNSTIEKLPEELRTAIQLTRDRGHELRGYRKVMDCPIGTVRSRIFRAREAIAGGQLRPFAGDAEG